MSKQKILKWSLFVLGLLIVSFGIALTIKANLGVAPWDAFHIGLTNYLPLSVGQASQITGLVIIILSFLIARIKPSWGTVLNMILVGLMIDLVLLFLPEASGLIIRYLYLGSGILIFGSGVGIYISASCGTGPRDSMMMALKKNLNFELGIIRSGMEIFVLVSGFLLGGPVGIGTLLIAVGVGPVVDISFKIITKVLNIISLKEPILRNKALD